jgi:GNAT superfamily N-acetyltransferase
MSSEFLIRRMQKQELKIALDWARQEGWNPGLHDQNCFYQADPQGFFIGFLGKDPIATASMVAYNNSFAFFGLFIVKPEFRHQGYGLRLTQEVLQYADERMTGLDGVLQQVPNYEKMGYRIAYKNIRYSFKPSLISAPLKNILNLEQIPFEKIILFDQICFPAKRSSFLECWINPPEGRALGYFENQQNLRGYGVIRRCFDGYKIGPLFAENVSIAETLLQALTHSIQATVYLDVPQINSEAQKLAQKYQMEPRFEVMRMYRNGTPPHSLDFVYGITTYELG